MIHHSKDPFTLQLSEETFDAGVVVRASVARHSSTQLVGYKGILIARTSVLTSAVAVEDRSFRLRIPSYGFSQGAFHKLGIDSLTRRIAN